MGSHCFLQYQKGGLQQQTKKRDSDLWDFKRIHHLIVAASIISLWATRSIFSLLQNKPKSNDFLLFKNLIFSKKPKSNDFFFKFNFFWRFRALFNQLKAPHTRCFSPVYMHTIFVGRDGRLDETFPFFLDSVFQFLKLVHFHTVKFNLRPILQINVHQMLLIFPPKLLL